MPKINCVLLIDDDKLTNFLNKILIDETDYFNHIVKRESAESGLRYLLDSGNPEENLPFPDIIFVDIDMPDFSGWEFMSHYENIKHKLPFRPEIFMLSLYTLIQDAIDVSNSPNLSGLIGKPLTVEILDAIIIQYFSAKYQNNLK